MIPRASVLITTELDSDVGTLGGLCAARGAVRSSLDPVKVMPGAPPRGTNGNELHPDCPCGHPRLRKVHGEWEMGGA